MNANEPAAPPTPVGAKPTSAHARPRLSRNTMLFYFAACLVGTFVAAYAWMTTPSATRLAADAMRLSSAGSNRGPIAQARPSPISAAAPASAASAAASAPPPRSAIELRSERLDADVQRLAQQASETERRFQQVEAAQEELRTKLGQVRSVAMQQQGSAKAPPRLARSNHAPAKPIADSAHETVLPPQVLAVDTWNGQPSVSIMFGTQVRFLMEGDSVSDLLVKKADPLTQRVDFATRDGKLVSSVSQAAGGAK